jgi:hypothetical protein
MIEQLLPNTNEMLQMYFGNPKFGSNAQIHEVSEENNE